MARFHSSIGRFKRGSRHTSSSTPKGFPFLNRKIQERALSRDSPFPSVGFHSSIGRFKSGMTRRLDPLDRMFPFLNRKIQELHLVRHGPGISGFPFLNRKIQESTRRSGSSSATWFPFLNRKIQEDEDGGPPQDPPSRFHSSIGRFKRPQASYPGMSPNGCFHSSIGRFKRMPAPQRFTPPPGFHSSIGRFKSRSTRSPPDFAKCSTSPRDAQAKERKSPKHRRPKDRATVSKVRRSPRSPALSKVDEREAPLHGASPRSRDTTSVGP